MSRDPSRRPPTRASRVRDRAHGDAGARVRAGRCGALLRALELTCLTLGGALLLLSLGSLAQSELRRSASLPDMRAWSEAARARYLAAAAEAPDTVLALLEAPDIDLSVPVYASHSALNLDRGAAIIDGMAYPHELGHIGIAGHRDGYFRALKDLSIGDTLRLASARGERRFVVDELRVIDPTELAYLQDTMDTRLTLVTCYPFHFIGSALQRFLVRAALLPSEPAQP